jgi:hypothetical protein
MRYQIVEGMSQNTIKCHYINTFVILELQFLLQFTIFVACMPIKTDIILVGKLRRLISALFPG